MAYAAITKTLIEAVHNTLYRLQAAELRPMPAPAVLIQQMVKSPDLLGLAVDKLWEPEKDLRDRLEKYNVQGDLFGECTVSLPEYADGVERQRDHNVTILFGAVSLPVFTASGQAHYYTRISRTVEFQESDDPRFREVALQTQAIQQVKDRWDAIATQVRTYLESCKSVNEAIKLWPDVARYLPLETLAKVNEKTEKAVAKESAAVIALRALDMGAINASNVLVRMAGTDV